MKKSKVLVVDDESDFRDIASYLLAKLNYEVATASRGSRRSARTGRTS